MADQKPKRIQRKRTKGWHMPPNTVPVTRPSEWGNPFKIGHHYKRNVGGFAYLEAYDGFQDATYTTIRTAAECVEWYRWWIERNPIQVQLAIYELRGRDLACWCPLVDKDGKPVPCHADLLLEIANG